VAGLRGLPYMQVILDRLADVQFARSVGLGDVCYGILPHRAANPCMLELIWSYWHEEAMLVQSINAVALRFQNISRDPGRDPLANLELDPLRPLGNLLWGYLQDEPSRLSVVRRAYEYDHHYGLRLVGRAVPATMRPADTRARFMAAFHDLLYRASLFFKEDDNRTIAADAFPVLNALRELHYVLAEGAHNQFGDLPTQARGEMLMQQWLLARPEMREFLRGRVSVPYPEAWMDRVDVMKGLQGWSDVSVIHYSDLARHGEQLLLSVRYGNWSVVNSAVNAANWARAWRDAIQRYVHAYRVVTGLDLSAAGAVAVRGAARAPAAVGSGAGPERRASRAPRRRPVRAQHARRRSGRAHARRPPRPRRDARLRPGAALAVRPPSANQRSIHMTGIYDLEAEPFELAPDAGELDELDAADELEMDGTEFEARRGQAGRAPAGKRTPGQARRQVPGGSPTRGAIVARFPDGTVIRRHPRLGYVHSPPRRAGVASELDPEITRAIPPITRDDTRALVLDTHRCSVSLDLLAGDAPPGWRPRPRLGHAHQPAARTHGRPQPLRPWRPWRCTGGARGTRVQLRAQARRRVRHRSQRPLPCARSLARFRRRPVRLRPHHPSHFFFCGFFWCVGVFCVCFFFLFFVCAPCFFFFF
jgi:hypothetical protein